MKVVQKKTLDSAIKAVIEMEFKGLEVNRADKVFEKYKRVKIEIIEKAFNGQSFSSLIPEINQITRELNKLTVQEDLLKIRACQENCVNGYVRISRLEPVCQIVWQIDLLLKPNF